MDNPNVAGGGSNRHFGQALNNKNIPTNAYGLPSGFANVQSRKTTDIKGQPSTALKGQSVPCESNYSKPYACKLPKMGTDYKQSGSSSLDSNFLPF